MDRVMETMYLKHDGSYVTVYDVDEYGDQLPEGTYIFFWFDPYGVLTARTRETLHPNESLAVHLGAEGYFPGDAHVRRESKGKKGFEGIVASVMQDDEEEPEEEEDTFAIYMGAYVG